MEYFAIPMAGALMGYLLLKLLLKHMLQVLTQQWMLV
jgi:hypothetical protein